MLQLALHSIAKHQWADALIVGPPYVGMPDLIYRMLKKRRGSACTHGRQSQALQAGPPRLMILISIIKHKLHLD